jgi:hypothetical protein
VVDSIGGSVFYGPRRFHNSLSASITNTPHTLLSDMLSPLDFEWLYLRLVICEGHTHTENLETAVTEQ